MVPVRRNRADHLHIGSSPALEEGRGTHWLN
jgi:hypothetical protein